MTPQIFDLLIYSAEAISTLGGKAIDFINSCKIWKVRNPDLQAGFEPLGSPEMARLYPTAPSAAIVASNGTPPGCLRIIGCCLASQHDWLKPVPRKPPMVVGKSIAADLPHMEDMNVQLANVMTVNPVTIGSNATLAMAKSLLDAGRFRRLPVVDEGKLVGILTERDIREHAGTLDHTRVNAAMRTVVITVTPADSVEKAARLMLEHKIGGLPVTAEGKLAGIVTMTDVVRAFLRVVRAAEEIMEE
jgi:acetoin utilization protein AcuB